MSGIFEWRHVVSPAETDELGHANNEAYLRWINAAALAHSTALGWSAEAYFARGEGWVVRRHEIDYLRPALPGTELMVQTWVRTFEKASSWRCYRILELETKALLAQAQTLWVWINYKTGRAARIPDELRQAFPVLPEGPA